MYARRVHAGSILLFLIAAAWVILAPPQFTKETSFILNHAAGILNGRAGATPFTSTLLCIWWRCVRIPASQVCYGPW